MKKLISLLLIAGIVLLSACAQAESFVLPLNARNAILIDGDTGETLYELRADERIYPASTTKILTVYLALLLEDTDRTATVSQTAVRLPEGAMRIGLEAGEKLTLHDLLLATLVKSGNDGANVIAESVSGSNEAFAALMNQYAIGIGCTDTHFVNPSGLHDEKHYTSARDMAKIAFEAMHLEAFSQLAGVSRYTLPATEQNEARALLSHGHSFFGNKKSEYYYPGARGIKTGYHEQAGYCFVACAQRDGKQLIAAVFGCGSYAQCFGDAARLFDFGFEKN